MSKHKRPYKKPDTDKVSGWAIAGVILAGISAIASVAQVIAAWLR